MLSIIDDNVSIVLHHQTGRLDALFIGFCGPHGCMTTTINNQIPVLLHDKAERTRSLVMRSC